MSSLKTEQKNENGSLVLSLTGAIDEDTEFAAVDTSSASAIIVDLNGVKSINSVGIREWLNWIRPLAEQKPLTLRNCPKSIVFQLNMVEGFLPKGGKVASFYVPYYCEKCDKESNILFNLGKEVSVDAGQVKVNFAISGSATGCAETPCQMEMDAAEAKYFQFLKKLA